jgi:hypothetical protein
VNFTFLADTGEGLLLGVFASLAVRTSPARIPEWKSAGTDFGLPATCRKGYRSSHKKNNCSHEDNLLPYVPPVFAFRSKLDPKKP